LLNVVNTGQTCQIWQAYHDGLERFFAVKTLLPDFQRKKEHAEYLKWESNVGAKLDHPNVMKIHEYGYARGMPYLAMEWFSSPNMKQWIRKGMENYGHLVPKMAIGAASGLAYFNDAGWVHRDVKPDNFMVTEDGQVKLIDFALARRGRGLLARLFSPKSKVQGTRSYISPEQLRGQALDGRADLYSLACTLFELVSGRPPFTGASSQELLQKHLAAQPPSLVALNDNATPEFADLVRRALAKDRAARPASTAAFLEELRGMRILRRDLPPPAKVDETGS
jgi:serine/threonine protein kinase